MKRLPVLGVAFLTILMLPADASAQRGGGAVRGGMRGAVVGGMVGGEGGAATGAKVGVVTGATRAAVNRETQSRTTYQSTAAYQSTPNSNFNEAPPELMAPATPAVAAKAGGETVVVHGGKPIVGVTFPADWKQKVGDGYVSAVSNDGQAYSVFASLAGITDKQAGIEKAKQGLEKYLTDVKYDDPVKRKDGSLVVTGTGKAKKAGVDVVFAAGVFDAGPGQLAGRRSSPMPRSKITTRKRSAASARRFAAAATSQSKRRHRRRNSREFCAAATRSTVQAGPADSFQLGSVAVVATK